MPTPVTGLKATQTLQQVRAEIRQAGRVPGEALPLGKNRNFWDSRLTASDLLIPVLEGQPNTPNHLERIVELRLYQAVSPPHHGAGPEPRLQLVDQLAITGPEESSAIAPLVEARSVHGGTSRPLPLTAMNRFEAQSLPPGTWFNLSGQWSQGGNTVAYGKVVHYNPGRFHLSIILDWSTTNGKVPHWQQITSGKTPELVLNQTVGMEPQFKIYQVQPRKFLPNPIQLEPISLAEPAINHPTYSQALLLARNGLWSISWQWLQSFKRRNKEKWSAVAQAQMDLIHWHARATQTQAEKSWASPNPQVLAHLVDGRWLRALQVFKSSPENSLETADLLRADSGRLLNRVGAVLQVNPAQPEVKAWGALLVAAQKDRKAAIAWLKKQSKTTASDLIRIHSLIQRIDSVLPPP
ncbi:hypothetical protein [Leptothermofonsia sp. ETS-13]|uniref:hypothetical protein n=1 Tax=Leptothermofonsia sp. ETS-13 TaxID=3035696 RepID=UPI003BA1C9E4